MTESIRVTPNYLLRPFPKVCWPYTDFLVRFSGRRCESLVSDWGD